MENGKMQNPANKLLFSLKVGLFTAKNEEFSHKIIRKVLIFCRNSSKKSTLNMITQSLSTT
jgi:hypothetical protein